jgi:hypothetical protein
MVIVGSPDKSLLLLGIDVESLLFGSSTCQGWRVTQNMNLLRRTLTRKPMATRDVIKEEPP